LDFPGLLSSAFLETADRLLMAVAVLDLLGKLERRLEKDGPARR
jgi:hypothetical protein